MKKNNWIWITITTVAVIIAVVFFILAHNARKYAFECEEESVETAQQLAEAQRLKNEAEFALEECEKKLPVEVEEVVVDTVVPAPPAPPVPPAPTVSNDDLQKQIADLKREISRRPAAANPAKQEVIVKVVHENAPVAQQDVIPRVIETVQPVVQRVVTSSSLKLPSYFYEDGQGVKWTARLGGNEGRHLPHLAIGDGIMGEQNGLSGFNWVEIELVEKIQGERGVTVGGTFFVLKSFIDKYMIQSDRGIVEIKAPATAWQPKRMSIERHNGVDYYVYHALK